MIVWEKDGVFVPFDGGRLANGQSASRQTAESWTDDELRDRGLFRAVPFVAPEGKGAAGLPRYERDGDVVREIYDVTDLAEAPPAVSAWPPDVVIAAIRSIDAERAEAILAGATELQKARFYTSRVVHLNDPEIAAALAAVSITQEEVEAKITELGF